MCLVHQLVPCMWIITLCFIGVGSVWGGAQAVGAESLLAHERGAALPACCCPHASSHAALSLFIELPDSWCLADAME